MSKSRLILWVVIPLAAAAAIVLLPPLLNRENTNVTRANFDRLKLGMTRAEVEAILGAGEEINQEVSQQYSASFFTYLGEPPAHTSIMLWKRGMRSIVIYFQDDKVVAMRTSLKAGE